MKKKIDFLKPFDENTPLKLTKITIFISIFNNLIEKKNRVQPGKNNYSTRLIVTVTLLGHQSSHSQNKLFFSLVLQYIIAIIRKSDK